MSVLDFADTDIPMDAAPLENGGDLVCDSCGNSFTHSGRGRKPKKCPDCRTGSKTNGAPRGRSSSADVRSALAVMESIYSTGALGLMFVSPAAASELSARIESAQRTNEMAFNADKALCRAVVKAGEKTGKGMFIAAQLSLIAPIAMVLFGEMQQRRADRASQEEEVYEAPAAPREPDIAYPNAGFFEK